MTAQPPPAAGVRLPWSELPAHVHAALEGWMGDPVAVAATQSGGFSPGVAARVRSVHGRHVFVKAINPRLNPDSPDIFRREARITALAGYFTQRSLLPAPPGLPTLRAFQAAQGVVARRWLAQRTGWM